MNRSRLLKDIGEKPLSNSLLIKNGAILDPVREKEFIGDIYIREGKIAEVGRQIEIPDAEVLDVNGLVITHGFCDIHAHFREPGREDKETLETGSQAALAGGFTTVCVMPNTNPPLDSPEAIRFIIETSESLPIRIYPIGAVTKGQEGKLLTEMASMIKAGAIAFSDDGIPISDAGILRRALEYATPLGVPIINHAEDLSLKGNGQMHEGTWSIRLGLAGIPDISESVMICRDLQILGFVGGKLHIPHVSSQKSIPWIRWAKENGWHVSAEVTPHHLYFSDENLRNFDSYFKVAPPLRSQEDGHSLMTALKDGTIDCIATDHAPHTIEEKEEPFDWAPFGMIGLESAFGAVWKILRRESFTLMEVIKKLTVAPRAIIGIEADLFKKGTPVELVILDPEKEWTFTVENIYSKSRNSGFIGEKLHGTIVYTISKGQFYSII